MALSASSILYHLKRLANWERFFSLLLIALPIVLVSWAVLMYALNLPFWDDFQVQDHLLFLKNSSGSQKLSHLFDQHWEHRIVWTRLVFAFYAMLNGSLNYYWLTIIGIIGLLIALGTLFAVFRQLSLPLLYFAPVPLLLFTLQSYESMIWAMASVQNFWFLAFALLVFYWLAQNTTRTRILALGMGILVTFSGGNGPIVMAAGLLVLAYQRQWRFAGYWALATAVCVTGYFYSYQRISFFPSPFRYPITDWIKAVFVFLGSLTNPWPNSGTSLLSYETTLWLTMATGIVVVIATGRFAFSLFRIFSTKQVDTSSSFFLGCILFIGATVAITVYSRVGFGGPGYLLQGRYKVYSALTLNVVYLFSLYTWQNKLFLPRYVVSIIIPTIGLSLLSDYLCLEGIINQHRRVVAEYVSYLANTPAERQQAARAIFVPTEPSFLSNQLTELTGESWWTALTTTNIDKLDEQPFMYNISKSDAASPTLLRPDDGSYIFFKSLTHTYLFAAQPVRPTSTILTGFSDYFMADGFYAQVLKEKLEPGRYRIGILTNQNNRIRLAMTNRYVTFTSL
jgi:hypothetical protein